MPPSLNILLVEDHPALTATLIDFFEDVGVEVDSAGTGREGLERAKCRSHDVIVLDLGLPDLDGIEVLRRLRTTLRLQTPVLILTARDTLKDKLGGFEAGAHDYLCKPFEPAELEARIRSLHRHHPIAQAEVLESHGVRLEPGTHQVTRDGQPVETTPTGFRILEVLMKASPDFRSREEMEKEVWGDFPPGSDALRTHLAQLRKHLDKPFDAPPVIETKYGVGTRFRGATDGG